MSVKEIEQAIIQLPRQELVELMSWLQEHHQQVWEKQIEDDLEAGRLDALLSEVEQEYAAVGVTDAFSAVHSASP